MLARWLTVRHLPNMKRLLSPLPEQVFNEQTPVSRRGNRCLRLVHLVTKIMRYEVLSGDHNVWFYLPLWLVKKCARAIGKTDISLRFSLSVP